MLIYVLRWRPSWISDQHKKQKICRGPSNAGHRLTLDPMGKCSNAFFSETTNMIKAKLYMNVHWMVLYNSLALIIFVVSEKKAFEHFPIWSNVNLCPALEVILDFR
jgi:hypothetical protein